MSNILTKHFSESFSEDKTFIFKEMGYGVGIRHFTIRNWGEVEMYLDDTKEPIMPGQVFTMEGPCVVCNDDRLVVKFKNEAGKRAASARYQVDVNHCPKK